VAGLLSLSLAGGTAGLAAASQTAGVGQVHTAALAASATVLGPPPSTERQELASARASRQRAAAAVPAPAPVAAVPVVPAPAPVAAPVAAVPVVPVAPAPAPASAPVVPGVPVPVPPPPPPPLPVLPGCEGSPSARYANGRLPEAALCRLPGTRGHELRPDAARAFVQLSAAYEAERGSPLCLTDSYRSYAQQVALARAKRGLAAPPGTSNHGSGIAVDLCGGIERFGTKAHAWMRANAGRFGWVHPTWAGPRGKRPEPWHWEYRP